MSGTPGAQRAGCATWSRCGRTIRRRARRCWHRCGRQERAADLAALIGACAVGLAREDEEWLEKALDDKRVQVREAAAQLLAAIPGSAYRARMAERALACCQVSGPGQLAVTPPAQFDAAMRRDALSQKAPQGWGERAWWLVQIVVRRPARLLVHFGQ